MTGRSGLPTWIVERIVADDLRLDEADAAKARATSLHELGYERAAIESSNEEVLKAHPPEAVLRALRSAARERAPQRPARPRRRWLLRAACFAAALTCIVFGWRALQRPPEFRKISLRGGESLYVDGLQWKGDVAAVSKDSLVAIAKAGTVVRFARAGRDFERLEQLPPVYESGAAVRISSDPRGCSAMIGASHLSASTPVAAPIPSFREVLVEVLCPGLPRRTTWVVGLPGQEVSVFVDHFDGH